MKPVLKIGLDFAAPYPLHSDISRGIFEGFEVDVMKRISSELKIKPEYKVSYWKNILKDLKHKKIDIICSAATKTKEREEEFLFTKPYLSFHLCLVCNKQNLIHFNELKGYTVGVRKSTEADKFLQEKYPGKELIYYDTNKEIYSDLTESKIHALIDDSPIAFGHIKYNTALSIVHILQETPSEYAIMLNKENLELKLQIDAVIIQLEKEGFLNACKLKWFENNTL